MVDSDIKKYSFKQGLPQEFEIVDIKQLYKESSEALMAPHRTGFYHVLWFREGSPTHVVDFKAIKIKANTILFLNKDTVHRFDEDGDFEGKVLLFTDDFFCKTDMDIKYLKTTILFNDLFTVSQISLPKSDNPFSRLFEQMETELANEKDNFQADILRNLLHTLLLLSDRERRQQDFKEIKKSADLDYVMLFRELVDNNFMTQKQVGAFARQLVVTEKRLNQATSKVLDKSPKQMIDERVMLEAKRLLAHTNESVKEIGFMLGFEEPTNFIKYFKKHHNLTPVKFKESLLL